MLAFARNIKEGNRKRNKGQNMGKIHSGACTFYILPSNPIQVIKNEVLTIQYANKIPTNQSSHYMTCRLISLASQEYLKDKSSLSYDTFKQYGCKSPMKFDSKS